MFVIEIWKLLGGEAHVCEVIVVDGGKRVKRWWWIENLD